MKNLINSFDGQKAGSVLKCLAGRAVKYRFLTFKMIIGPQRLDGDWAWIKSKSESYGSDT